MRATDDVLAHKGFWKGTHVLGFRSGARETKSVAEASRVAQRRGVVTHGCRDRLETDRPTAVGLEDRPQILSVQFIKSLAIDALE